MSNSKKNPKKSPRSKSPAPSPSPTAAAATNKEAISQPIPAAPALEPAPPPKVITTAADGPQLKKYESMLKIGLPRGAVEQKMIAEGVDPGLLAGSEGGSDKPAPPPGGSGGEVGAVNGQVPEKYLKMLKVGPGSHSTLTRCVHPRMSRHDHVTIQHHGHRRCTCRVELSRSR